MDTRILTLKCKYRAVVYHLMVTAKLKKFEQVPSKDGTDVMGMQVD